jgi:uncharacterized membrane protein YgdD (TMEM256/DUF423 family)
LSLVLLGEKPLQARAASERKESAVRLGIRQILLIAAVALFVIAALGDTNSFDLLAIGLACFAGALVVEELGLGRRRFGRR